MQRLFTLLHLAFFFCLGAVTTTLILLSVAYLVFMSRYQDRAFPGVKVASVDVSGKTEEEIATVLTTTYRFGPTPPLTLHFSSPEASLAATAQELNLALDTRLMASRALSIGRQTPNPYFNLLQIVAAYNHAINLPLEISYHSRLLGQKLDAVAPLIEKEPVSAIFDFNPEAGPDRKGRVEAFSPSKNGLALDRPKIIPSLVSQTKFFLTNRGGSGGDSLNIPLYTKTVYPSVQTSAAETYGLHDLLGQGKSYFYDSIPGRVYNISLGTQKVSGRLVAPGEIFSFNESIGTVSAVFGFQKAYSIIKGKTVLDDGGGVCQVSTTLYRAVLNAGLPVVERVAHAYRVGFYEQGGFFPGLDAPVYPPSPDFRFQNDTGHWLLLQANFDQAKKQLTFDIFGTADGRQTTIDGPYFLSTSPPPEPVYEDDPTLPASQVKQVDTAHAGAKVYFKRKVTRGDEVLIDETVNSNYIPWPARYLRGTKT